jgi:hypothetical protein
LIYSVSALIVVEGGEEHKVGVDLSLQAIPEGCELVIKARINREVAEYLDMFHIFVTGKECLPYDSTAIFVCEAAKALVREHPGLIQRHFREAGRRKWDAILYLLDPECWLNDCGNDKSLVNKAITGSERLHPDATASQGNPIGFVPAHEVRAIVDYFDTVTVEQLHEHYDPDVMWELGVYKMSPGYAEHQFSNIWEEFVGIRDFYREAAAHNEAVITVID